MEKYNIFQGNQLITEQTAKSLGYEINENTKYRWFTEDIFLQTYFYLNQRFGPPTMTGASIAGIWVFEVKQYSIWIELNSSWVSFMVFGNGEKKNFSSKKNFINYSARTPHLVHLWRQQAKNADKLIPMSEKETADATPSQKQVQDEQFTKFCAEHNLVESELTNEIFVPYRMKWFDWCMKYNSSFAKMNWQEFGDKYGEHYQNSCTRHALRTLDQFIKNLLTPIWIRDVPFNIKGKIGDGDAVEFEVNYKNNIEIVFEQAKKEVIKDGEQ